MGTAMDRDHFVTKLGVRNRKAVRGYSRIRRGKLEFVRPYQREQDEKPDTDSKQKRKAEELRAAKTRDIDLWRQWRATGDKKILKALLKSLDPLIKSEARQYYVLRDIPQSAIDAEFYKQALVALKTYDPERGAALGTHVRNMMKKAKRFITTNQNVGRIPEHRTYKLQDFRRAQEELERLGIPYTDEAMSQHLGWPIAEVRRMAAEDRKSLLTHKFEEDPSEETASDEAEVAYLVRYDLTPDEKKVYDLYFSGVRSTSEIAKKTGFDASKVSRLRANIASKMQKYL